ncbi:hypothetical protein DY000_02042735 [Brassica cretica]|uniref:Uncharacterized protein n=1 Tax=Brassica cretica TaxID=69181 RepID=A0ABQ7BHJ2_BRACR|nr:hypothetical protein DY000_02042735 [Brassica cretica]
MKPSKDNRRKEIEPRVIDTASSTFYPLNIALYLLSPPKITLSLLSPLSIALTLISPPNIAFSLLSPHPASPVHFLRIAHCLRSCSASHVTPPQSSPSPLPPNISINPLDHNAVPVNLLTVGSGGK